MPSPLHFPGMTYILGPYIVTYTDLPVSGNYKVLWTPTVGDILLGLWVDLNTAIPGQTNGGPFTSAGLEIGTSVSSDLFAVGNTYDFNGFKPTMTGTTIPCVITTVNPIRLTYNDFGEGNMTAGYGVFYALIAKSPQP